MRHVFVVRWFHCF